MHSVHPVLRIFAGLTVCGLLLLTLTGAAFVSAGTMYVSVHEKSTDGISIGLPIPVNLAHVALALVPDEELGELRAEIGPWLPVVEAALDELARCPDGVLVEVEDGSELVRIVKQGRNVLVDVDTNDETVHVSVPVRGVARLIDRLAAKVGADL